MIPGKEFMVLMEAERKLKRGDTLSPEEQAAVKKYGVTPPKICGHKGCKNELGPRVDGERQKINGVEVCDDCYFDELGDELENYPIMPPRLRRRVS